MGGRKQRRALRVIAGSQGTGGYYDCRSSSAGRQHLDRNRLDDTGAAMFSLSMPGELGVALMLILESVPSGTQRRDLYRRLSKPRHWRSTLSTHSFGLWMAGSRNPLPFSRSDVVG